MYLEDIQKELDNLEINDLDSAIKGIILGDLQCTLEDSKNSKIIFTTVHDIDDIVNELDEYVGEVISNHLCDCIEVVSDKQKEEDICL